MRELIRIIDREAISVVHCHNPMVGYWGVLQPYSVKESHLWFTQHMDFTFSGSTGKNWLFYYPVEKVLAKFSDIIITINHEDYTRADKFHYKKMGEQH